MSASHPSGWGVLEHLRNLEPQTQDSGQATNRWAFCSSSSFNSRI
jgi:hypothetical protein